MTLWHFTLIKSPSLKHQLSDLNDYYETVNSGGEYSNEVFLRVTNRTGQAEKNLLGPAGPSRFFSACPVRFVTRRNTSLLYQLSVYTITTLFFILTFTSIEITLLSQYTIFISLQKYHFNQAWTGTHLRALPFQRVRDPSYT